MLSRQCPFIVNRCKLRWKIAQLVRELRATRTEYLTTHEKNRAIRSHARNYANTLYALRSW